MDLRRQGVRGSVRSHEAHERRVPPRVLSIEERSNPGRRASASRHEDRTALLEGNYLLAWDDERWSPLRDNGVFDETWYVACMSLDDQRERLVRRHMETWTDEKTRMFGEGTAGARARADMNDMRNLEWIESTSRRHADRVIESL